MPLTPSPAYHPNEKGVDAGFLKPLLKKAVTASYYFTEE